MRSAEQLMLPFRQQSAIVASIVAGIVAAGKFALDDYWL